jgi:hypothetical protein
VVMISNVGGVADMLIAEIGDGRWKKEQEGMEKEEAEIVRKCDAFFASGQDRTSDH